MSDGKSTTEWIALHWPGVMDSSPHSLICLIAMWDFHEEEFDRLPGVMKAAHLSKQEFVRGKVDNYITRGKREREVK